MKIEVTEEMREQVTLYRIEKANARFAIDVTDAHAHVERATNHARAIAALVAEQVEKESQRCAE